MTQFLRFSNAIILLLTLFGFRVDAGDLFDGVKLREPLTSPRNYHGTRRFESRSGGTFCEKYQIIDLEWRATLRDVKMDFLDNGVMDVDFLFAENFVNAKMFRKGGILCSQTRSQGQVVVDAASVKIRFFPANENNKARFKIDQMQIVGLHLKSFEHEGWGLKVRGDLPDEIASWIEGQFNSIMAWFVNTSIAQRLVDFLSDRLIGNIGLHSLKPIE